MRLRVGWIGVAATMLLSGVAVGHVFWLQPAEYRVKAGELIKLKFHVGDDYPGAVMPRQDSRIVKFVWGGPEGSKDVVGRDADEVAGIAKFKTPGVYVFGYQSTPASVSLEEAKFDSYLKEEGLEKILKQRASVGVSGGGRAVQEAYARCAKAIVSVSSGGECPRAGFDRVFGLRVELIAETDPAAAAKSKMIRVRLLKDGAPLEGCLVKAHSASSFVVTGGVRTDVEGRAEVPIATPGIWVLNAVEMMAASRDSKADWESVWSSLSFEVPAGQ